MLLYFRTRSALNEEANLSSYLKVSLPDKWIESSYEAEGPLYWATMSIPLHSYQKWLTNRLTHLKRLIVLAHARHSQPVGPCKQLDDKETKEYSVYRPYLIFFGIIDGIYDCFFKVSFHINYYCCVYYYLLYFIEHRWC